MDLGLNGKVALVTGGSQGIGRAVASRFAKEGADVAISARGKEQLDAAAAFIRMAHERPILTIVADQRKNEDIVRMIEDTVTHFGGLDYLVICAGTAVLGDFMTIPDERWREELDLRLMGMHRCCRAAIPYMRRRGGGAIVVMSSNAGMAPLVEMPGTSAMYAAQINLGKSYAKIFARDKIRVNTLNLGPIMTEGTRAQCEAMAQSHGITLDEAVVLSCGRVPLGRHGTPDEVAYVTAFLCSDLAGFITGAAIEVDGGSADYI
jgi:NAD(P)-dependent dehydrogenase (short-subunit alcohol dehydrogenase family)